MALGKLFMKISSAKLSSKILIGIFLLISILAVYYQVKKFEFINFDDGLYVTDNPMVKQGITLDSIRWAFSSIGYAANWHPVTWLSHMLDVELYGLNPGMHHLTNVIFHIANTLLLFFLFYRLTNEKWKCAAVAALFALHPLHVESVAWIAERKDVLSTFFWILTTWSYVWYVECRGVRRYLLVMVLFVLGLMAKSMLVTLPFTLLLLDFWPIKRPELVRPEGDVSSQAMRNNINGIHWAGVGSCIWEKTPLFILAGISSIITYLAQRRGGALVSNFENLSISIRIANAATAYCTYLWRIIWPFNLAVFYPYPKMLNTLIVVGSLFLLLLVTLLVFKYTKRFPFLIMGWLWYLGALIPVIGIVQIGGQSMADRYTYIPFIGIFVMLVWGISSLFRQWRIGKYFLAVSFIAIIPILMWVTWLQVSYWKDSITLFSHALDVTKDNYVAHENLASALGTKGDFQRAIYHYSEALKIYPKNILAHCGLGSTFKDMHKNDEAIKQFSEALKIDPKCVPAHCGLGLTFKDMHKIDEAIKQFSEALKIDPKCVLAHCDLGLTFKDMHKNDEAIKQFSEALKIDPNNADAYFELGTIYAGMGMNDEAINHYNEALIINPIFIEVLVNFGNLMLSKGNYDEAIRSYLDVIKKDTHQAVAYSNLGSAYLFKGNLKKAIEYSQESLRQKPDYAPAAENLKTAQMNLINFEKLLQQTQDAIKANPQNPMLYTKLGDVNRLMGEYDEATAQYQKALSIQPKYIQAMYGLVLVYSSGQEDYAKALDMLERMRQFQPGNPTIYYNIACIYSKQNMAKESIGWLNQAIDKGFKNWDQIKKDPDLANIRGTDFYRKLIHRGQG